MHSIIVSTKLVTDTGVALCHSIGQYCKKNEHRLTVQSTVQATILACTVEPRLSEPRYPNLNLLSLMRFIEFIEFLVGINWKRPVQYIKLYTLILVIRTFQLSEWLLEQRCSDNSGGH